VRQALLGLLPKASVGAEIGVSSGGFSQEIMRIVQPKSLVLIDPWDLLADQEPESGDEGRWFNDKAGMADKHRGVIELFRDAPSVSVVRGFSQERLLDYRDDHFDWVYLDAHHRYEPVYNELKLCIRKVKVGGLITGDDFFKKHKGNAEVKQAVRDVLREHGEDRGLNVLDLDHMPDRVTDPSRIGQQFIFPVTQRMKDEAAIRNEPK